MKRQRKGAKNPKPTKMRKITKGVKTLAIKSGLGSFPRPLINIASWNVNGLRAAEQKAPVQKFFALDFDILCLNETKLQDMNIPEVEHSFQAYPYRYWSCSQIKKGYSGVALFSKVEPISCTNGIGIKKYDVEGRSITAEFDTFYVVSTYVPNVGGKLERLDYRTK